jgi:hypothetical protein
MPINLSGSLVLTGSITTTGTITMSGSIASASYAVSSSNTFLATNVVGTANRILFNSAANTTTTSNNLTWEDSINLMTLGSNTGTAGTISKIALYTSSFGGYGFGVSPAQLDYVSDGSHVFYKNGATPTELVRIANNGDVSISGSLNVTGSAIINNLTGSLYGTASYALTASSADAFTVRNTLTAQTLVVQIITSSVDFVTGSTRFGSILENTHVFTGSMLVTGSGTFASSITANGGLIAAGSPTGYPLGELQFSLTGNDSYSGISTLGTGTTTLYFDHRATSNTGNFIFRNGTGAANTLLTIAGSGAATFSSSITATQGNFSLGTVGGAIGSVKNLTVTNTNGAIGDWAGLNFAYYNNGTNFGYIGTIVTSDSTNSIADLVFGVKASTSVTAVTEYMRIKGGGNVGIGIANPAQTLEVNGNILASSTGKIGFRYSSGDGNYYSYLRSATASGVGPIVLAGGFESGGGSNEAIRFATNANPGERIAVSILNNGRVGINTTTPTTQLQIRKNYWQFWDEKTHSSNVDLFSITLPHFGAAIVTIAGSRYSPGADNYSGTSTFYIFVTNTGVVSVNGGINFGTWSISTSVSSKTVTFTSAYAGSSPNYTGYSVIVQGSGHNNGSESAVYVTIA